MRQITSRAALVSVAAGWALVALSGCARDRPGVQPPLDQAGVAASTVHQSQYFVVTEPKSGSNLRSPVTVRVNAADLSPLLLAAQVQSLSADKSGAREWRGNATLAKAADGAYVGQITYHLDAGTSGVIEVSLVDPASGTLVETTSIPVALQAAP